MNLLHLDSSILGDHSASRQLTREVVHAYLNAHADSQVTYRDLASDALGHFSAASLAAAGTPVDVRDAAQQQEVAGNEATLQQFLDSDVLVIGAPMYNFTIPTQLKAWFDRILIAGRTFRYSKRALKACVAARKSLSFPPRAGCTPGNPRAPVTKSCSRRCSPSSVSPTCNSFAPTAWRMAKSRVPAP